MNKIGLSYHYWKADGGMFSVDKIIELSKKSFVDTVEINSSVILNMDIHEKNEFKKKFDNADLLYCFTGGLDPQTDIASNDEAVRKRGIEYSKRFLQAISDAGGDKFVGLNYSYWLRRPNDFLTIDEKKRYLDFSIRSMREIMKTAENVGVVYCYEIVNRFEQFLFNTIDEGIEYCKAVGSPNAKLLLDTFHMIIEEDNIINSIMEAGKQGYIAHFHVGESNRRVPGSGPSNMDWIGIFSALKKVGYTGCIMMEPFVLMGNYKICVWRDLVSDKTEQSMIDYAVKGVKFIKSCLQG